jgi:predicted signal transduction protein with EAL and GGDEF domain
MEDEFAAGESRISIGVSIGIAVYPSHGDDAHMLLANADAALYQAKAEARGSIRIFDSDVAQGVRERRNLRNEIELALAQDAFQLHYQPQVDAQSRQPKALEALLRWPHPERGLIPPSTFIPIAEESRLIGQLGLWVLREACREAASWTHPLRVAINVSPLQFQSGDLVETVHAALLQTGLPGNRLEVEITESVLIGDFSRVSSILRRLKALGVQIALDDFGTGYSSLSYLHSFPFDKIKLDRSFVTDLPANHHSQTIAKSIIALSHNLKVPVIAEGVESEEQRAMLLSYGCDELQGFLTGKPRPIADYAQMVGGKPMKATARSA